MKNFENETKVGNEVTKGVTEHGVVYELTTTLDDGVLTEAYLDIITPAAFIIVLQNLTSEQVDELVDKLINEYSYDMGECVSLKIPESEYDCIFLRSSIIDEHPLGFYIVEGDQLYDGHEVEICDVLIDYMASIRKTDDFNDHENYVGFSILYDMEILPDDNAFNVIESCEETNEGEKIITTKTVGLDGDLIASRFCIKRGFSYEDITFTFHHLKSERKHIVPTKVAEN